MISIAVLLAVSVIANLYTWSRTLQSLVFSQRRQLRRRIARLETLKSEGFLQTLRSEVNLMTEMVRICLLFRIVANISLYCGLIVVLL